MAEPPQEVTVARPLILEAAPQEASAVPEYVRVPLENLLPGRPLPFSLYYSMDDEFILLRGAGKRLKRAERDQLLQNHIAELYIPGAELPQYRTYLDQILKDLLLVKDIPVAQKVETFYSLALGIGNEVMAAPQKPESISSAAEVVRGALSLLANGKEVIHQLMGLMSDQYDLVTHSINATNYGLALARAVGLKDQRSILNLGLGLFLHDVGLRLVPEDLLRRRGLLSSQERLVLAKHTLLGVDLFLPGSLLPESTLAVIRDHHERCDGSGYPGGLTAEKLSLEARIAQIVTAFDFLTTNNPSRRAVSSFEAIRSMHRDQPGAFDKDLLRRFISIIGKEASRPTVNT